MRGLALILALIFGGCSVRFEIAPRSNAELTRAEVKQALDQRDQAIAALAKRLEELKK